MVETVTLLAASTVGLAVDGETIPYVSLGDEVYKIWNRLWSGVLLPAPGQCGGDPHAARLRGPPARDAGCAGGR